MTNNNSNKKIGLSIIILVAITTSCEKTQKQHPQAPKDHIIGDKTIEEGEEGNIYFVEVAKKDFPNIQHGKDGKVTLSLSQYPDVSVVPVSSLETSFDLAKTETSSSLEGTVYIMSECDCNNFDEEHSNADFAFQTCSLLKSAKDVGITTELNDLAESCQYLHSVHFKDLIIQEIEDPKFALTRPSAAKLRYEGGKKASKIVGASKTILDTKIEALKSSNSHLQAIARLKKQKGSLTAQKIPVNGSAQSAALRTAKAQGLRDINTKIQTRITAYETSAKQLTLVQLGKFRNILLGKVDDTPSLTAGDKNLYKRTIRNNIKLLNSLRGTYERTLRILRRRFPSE